MKAVFVGSESEYSGKSLVCLCLGRRLKEKGLKVGYFKPYGTLPCLRCDQEFDEDAELLKEQLDLAEDALDISPVVRTHELRIRALRGELKDVRKTIMAAWEKVSAGKDVMLIGGGRTMNEGWWLDYPIMDFIREVGARTLMIERYDETRGLSSALAWRSYLGDGYIGLILNRLDPDHLEHIEKLVVPFLEKKNVPVLGIIPTDRTLASMSVADISRAIGGQMYTASDQADMLVQNMLVGAMNLDAAAARFRKVHNKAVITGGDRIDLQVAALETSTRCLILTGGIAPHPLILSKADEMKVPVIVVQEDTLAVVEKLDSLVGRPRIREPEKIKRAMELFDQCVNVERMGL